MLRREHHLPAVALHRGAGRHEGEAAEPRAERARREVDPREPRRRREPLGERSLRHRGAGVGEPGVRARRGRRRRRSGGARDAVRRSHLGRALGDGERGRRGGGRQRGERRVRRVRAGREGSGGEEKEAAEGAKEVHGRRSVGRAGRFVTQRRGCGLDSVPPDHHDHVTARRRVGTARVSERTRAATVRERTRTARVSKRQQVLGVMARASSDCERRAAAC